MTRGSLRRVALLGVIVLFAACGGGDGGGAETAAGPAGPAVAGALASVVRVEAAVDAAIAGDGFAEVGDPVEVNPGDDVRTDTSGFAEVTYFDGSVTRLDVSTDFTVSELVDGPDGSTIRTEMGAGRTYHRVSELTGGDTYEVSTSVATATVRGTAFVVTCSLGPTTVCGFDVLDGIVEVTATGGEPISLEAGESVVVTAEGAGEPGPVDPALLGDAWIVRNIGLDTDAGHTELALAAVDPTRFSESEASDLAGTFDLAITVVDGNDALPVGTSNATQFTFTATCDDEGCQITGSGQIGEGLRWRGGMRFAGSAPGLCGTDSSITTTDTFVLDFVADGDGGLIGENHRTTIETGGCPNIVVDPVVEEWIGSPSAASSTTSGPPTSGPPTS